MFWSNVQCIPGLPVSPFQSSPPQDLTGTLTVVKFFCYETLHGCANTPHCPTNLFLSFKNLLNVRLQEIQKMATLLVRFIHWAPKSHFRVRKVTSCWE